MWEGYYRATHKFLNKNTGHTQSIRPQVRRIVGESENRGGWCEEDPACVQSSDYEYAPFGILSIRAPADLIPGYTQASSTVQMNRDYVLENL